MTIDQTGVDSELSRDSHINPDSLFACLLYTSDAADE